MNTGQPAASASVSAGAERWAGGFLLAGFVVTVIAMLHHPTSIRSPVIVGPVTVGNLVHLTMMGVVFGNLWALAIVVRRSFTGPYMAMWIAYALASVANLTAATVSGFALPILSEHADLAASPDLARVLWALNQGFDRTGLFLTVLAFTAWAIGLMLNRRGPDTGLALIALACGALPALALVTGLVTFDVHGALLIYGLQALWLAIAGAMLLWRGRV